MEKCMLVVTNLCELESGFDGEIITRHLLRLVVSNVRAQVEHESVESLPQWFSKTTHSKRCALWKHQKLAAVCPAAVNCLLQLTISADADDEQDDLLRHLLGTILLLSEELFLTKYCCSGTVQLILGLFYFSTTLNISKQSWSSSQNSWSSCQWSSRQKSLLVNQQHQQEVGLWISLKKNYCSSRSGRKVWPKKFYEKCEDQSYSSNCLCYVLLWHHTAIGIGRMEVVGYCYGHRQ